MTKVMLRAPFYLSKLCIPHMKKSKDGTGSIGNMCSVHGHMVTKNKPVYNITKFGLRGLAQSIAAEGEGKIRGFTVSVGFVRTPLALKQIPDQAKQRGGSRRRGCERCDDGEVANQRDDDAHRSGKPLCHRFFLSGEISHWRGSSVRWGNGQNLLKTF